MLRLESPAKINLFLDVGGLRPDGYHEIHTLFERVALCDTLEFKEAKSGIRIDLQSQGRLGRSIPRGPSNLIYRAAHLLKDRFRVRSGLYVRVKKIIPPSAGLGGGSSNAVTTLCGLNQLWKLGLKRNVLRELSASLGSDCAFFSMDTSFAEGRGRGELLNKIQSPGAKIWHVLLKPAFGISTQKAYQAMDKARSDEPDSALTARKVSAKLLLRRLQEGDTKCLSDTISNSFELVLGKRVKEIQSLKDRLISRGAQAALMSGSGSAVFGIFPDKKSARGAAKTFREGNIQVFVASTR